MRKLIYSMNTSLDLFVEDRDGEFKWSTPDVEIHKHYNALFATMRTHLYGRRLWEVMAEYWPTAASDPECTRETLEFARFWNAAEHIVFSRSLQKVEHGARLVRDNAVEEVKKLKSGEGTDMYVGGPDLASTFIEAGLVDEIHAYVSPVAIGGGKPFLPGLKTPLELTLAGIQTFASGVVQLRYVPRIK
ncbi:MAG TPA: dihydrofolate reductase family protein [Candidatus Eremiobacteraceae bacterium]|nr:dihydrofolate reductase family protein [Candidatus Eremiobacteraceae bacterium]